MANVSKANSSKGLAPKRTRNPKCARCRNHEFIVSLKGHVGRCPFTRCICWKCALITERTKIMAKQRRIKKNQPLTEDSAENEALERPSFVNISGTVDGALGQKATANACVSPDGRNLVETVVKIPPCRFEEAVDKTYAELEVPRHDISATEEPWTIREPPQRKLPHGGADHSAVDCRDGDGRDSYNAHMPWSGSQHDAPFMIAQRDIFSGEMMALPMPLRFYSRINTGYAACPAILVNMPPPPPQGIFKSGHGPMVFQHFPRAPGTIHYHPEPTPTTGNTLSEYTVPFFSPPPPTTRLEGIHEELSPRMNPQPGPSGGREHGADRLAFGSQGSQGNSVEDYSSQENI